MIVFMIYYLRSIYLGMIYRKNGSGKKELLALEIIKLIPFKAKVLSFGTGLGFVEDKILAFRDDIQLSCFDTSKNHQSGS